MPRDIGQLTALDEHLSHQTTNTFAVPGQSDLGWAEKIWVTMGRRDGSLQCDLGIGKYANRGVIDAFAGVARDIEQWTVRASRALASDPESIDVGPVRYEIFEPLRSVRAVLEPNAVQPVAFDITFTAVLPPFFEDRDLGVEQGRVVTDILRWHQAGTVAGTVTIDGVTHDVTPDEWFAFRDRSWGVRQYVGVEPVDLPPSDRANFMSHLQMHWCPVTLFRPDGTPYEFHYYFRDAGPVRTHFTSHVNDADGTQQRVLHVESGIKYDAVTRDIVGGEVTAILAGADRKEWTFTVEPVSRTGFRLNPALYFGWKGMYHGTWKGELHLDGEYIADCPAEIDAREVPIWQLRDRIIKVTEGSAEGFGILESIVIGDWPCC